jgi:hypothetical protein
MPTTVQQSLFIKPGDYGREEINGSNFSGKVHQGLVCNDRGRRLRRSSDTTTCKGQASARVFCGPLLIVFINDFQNFKFMLHKNNNNRNIAAP